MDEPREKNYDVLKPGTDRDLVRAELGAPLPSSGGASCDVFAFDEGSTGWKYMRAMGYSLLDIGTLGLSEVVANPVEASVGKDKVQLRVCYSVTQNVLYTERLEVGKPAKLMTGAYPPLGTYPPRPAVETSTLPAVATPVEQAPATAPAAAPAADQTQTPGSAPVPPTIAASPATPPPDNGAAQPTTNQ